MGVFVLFPQGVVPVDPAGGTELGHGRQRSNFSCQSVLFFQFVQHDFLVPDEVFADAFHCGSGEQRYIFRLSASIQTGSAAAYRSNGLSCFPGFQGFPAPIQRHLSANVGEIVLSGYCRHTGTTQQIGISRGVHNHLCRIQFQSGFAVCHHTGTVLPFHHRMHRIAVEQQRHPGVMEHFRQLQGEDVW